MSVIDAGTRRTAYNPAPRGADPNCGVCMGTGVDLIFESECSECWSRRDANIADAREMHRQRFAEMRATNGLDPYAQPAFDMQAWTYAEHAGLTWEAAQELRQTLMGRGERPATQDDSDRFDDYLYELSHPPI